MRTTVRAVPPPGSAAAAEHGCRCPVWDNNRGQVPPFPAAFADGSDGWHIHPKCPLHQPDIDRSQRLR